MPSASSEALARSISSSVWSISRACASIGTSILTGPNADARSSARSWVRNIAGSDRDQRIARSPSAGLGAVSNRSSRPSRTSSGLSAPMSMVRMVTGSPFIDSTAVR